MSGDARQSRLPRNHKSERHAEITQELVGIPRADKLTVQMVNPVVAGTLLV